MHSTKSLSSRSPSIPLLALEPVRALCEYARYRLANQAMQPRGDGHSVIVFPGLGTNEWMTRPLLSTCERIGYHAVDWGHGFNLGPKGDILHWLDKLALSVASQTSDRPSPITLIGWSLGGLYAREVAKRLSHKVRQVITIGTPLSGTSKDTNAATVYRVLNGKKPPRDRHLIGALRTAPRLPVTSIYSRSDGIVSWKACLDETNAAQVENIEVDGSHCGMCWNPQVHDVIADRLSQPLNGWKPYRPPAAHVTPSKRIVQGPPRTTLN